MLQAPDHTGIFPRYLAPPPAIPSGMKWLLAGCIIVLAILPWTIPVLILRIITP